MPLKYIERYKSYLTPTTNEDTAFYAGWTKAWAAFNLAKEVWNDTDTIVITEKDKYAQTIMFPIGEPNNAYAKYFIGQNYIAPISTTQVKMFNVTFEPRCRNNWHIHHAKQGGGCNRRQRLLPRMG